MPVSIFAKGREFGALPVPYLKKGVMVNWFNDGRCLRAYAGYFPTEEAAKEFAKWVRVEGARAAVERLYAKQWIVHAAYKHYDLLGDVLEAHA